MPRVPEYGGLQVAKDVPNFPALQAPHMPDIAGRQARALGAASEGIAALNREAVRISAALQEQADSVRVNDALNEARRLRNHLTIDQNEGYTHRKGKDALDKLSDGKSVLESWQEKYRKGLADIEARLFGEQKKKFRERADILYNQYEERLMQHVNAEFSAHRASSNVAGIALDQEDMANFYGDERLYRQARDSMMFRVHDLGKMQGWSGNQIELETLRQLSKGHKGAIESAVDAGNLDVAKGILSQYKSELTGNDFEKVNNLVNKADELAIAQLMVEEARSLHPGDLTGQLDWLRKNSKGSQEERNVSLAKTRDNEDKAAEKEAYTNFYKDAYNRVRASPREETLKLSEWEKLDPEHEEKIRRLIASEQRAAAVGEEVKTDPEIYRAIRMFSVDDPVNFANYALQQYWHKLSPGDRKKFDDLQAKVRAEIKKNGVNAPRLVTEREFYGYAKKLTAGMSEEDAKSFDGQVDAELGIYLENNDGRMPERKVRDGMLEGLLFEARTRRQIEASSMSHNEKVWASMKALLKGEREIVRLGAVPAEPVYKIRARGEQAIPSYTAEEKARFDGLWFRVGNKPFKNDAERVAKMVQYYGHADPFAEERTRDGTQFREIRDLSGRLIDAVPVAPSTFLEP
ncbi:MAG: hypothetical protein LBI35_01505 [Burkholderiales bacterium]|jgi:hypothetical protein|nr:hypothetical protein [Burkholderiales bacterium]